MNIVPKKVKLSLYAKIFYNAWRVHPERTDYSIVIDQELFGSINVERLRTAIARMTSDYFVMQSVVKEEQGELYWVPSENHAEFRYYKNISQELISDYLHEPFDLLNKPPLKSFLIKVSDRHFRFIVVTHHIVSDGTKIDPFVDSISRYYNDQNYSYPVSIERQIEKINQVNESLYLSYLNNSAQNREFWNQKLANVAGPDLTFLRPVALEVNDNLIGEYRFAFSEATSERAHQLRRKYVTTPYLFGQCVFMLLLHKYTGQKKFGICYPVSIKEGAELIYGVHVNTNIVIYDFEKAGHFRDLLDQARTHLRETKQHKNHYYPLQETIVDHNNVLDVGFIQTSLKDKKFEFTDVLAVLNSDFNIDLFCHLLFETEIIQETIYYRVKYNKKYVDGHLLSNFITSYKKLFSDILEDLTVESTLKQLTDYHIPSNFIGYPIYGSSTLVPKSNEKKTIHCIFEEQAEKTPEKVAVVFEKESLTYSTLNKRANQIAHFLKTQYNVLPNDFVLLFLDKNQHIPLAIIATLKSGAAYVPVDPEHPADRISYIISEVKPKAVITSQSNLKALYRYFPEQDVIFVIDEQEHIQKTHKYSETNPCVAAKNSDLAYAIYTSGTTGKPKGVLQQHENIVRLFTQTEPWFHFDETDVWTLFHSYVFDFSIWEMFGALLHGGKLIIPTIACSKDVSLFYQLCDQGKVTVLNQTPTVFYHFSHFSLAQKEKLATLRYVIFGGEKLNFQNLKPWVELYGYDSPMLINMYGITETAIHVTYKKIHERDIDTRSWIGLPIPDQFIVLLDENLELLPIGAIGEMYIGGAGLAQGYLEQEALTEERFIQHPIYNRLYKSGDLARMLPDNRLEYIGRNDKQIKLRGYRIELQEIENRIQHYPGIKQAFVLLNQSNDDAYLVAYYVAEEEISNPNLKNFLALTLPAYMVPTRWLRLEALPLTINGKIDTDALPLPALVKLDDYIAPRNQKEVVICQGYSEILAVKKTGIDDDFFDLGGNSLKAIALTVYFQKNNLSLSVADIFKFKTPRRIAKYATFAEYNIHEKLKKIKLIYQNHKNSFDTRPEYRDKIETYNKTVSQIKTIPYTKKNIHSVLLTGATGYLGCNILNQLLGNSDYVIFLIVRANSKQEAFDRIRNKYQFYFDEDLAIYDQPRMFVFSGDLEKKDLGLHKEDYEALSKNVDSIIHAAALTKHYGEYRTFYSANVRATTHLLNFSKLTKLKDFHYISTCSVVAHNANYFTRQRVFTEDDTSENLLAPSNFYVRTKYKAEKQVITYQRKYGINGTIYRVGNLAFISKNRRVQENIEENAFFHRLHAIFKLKALTKEMSVEEISPVDFTADAIVKIFDKQTLDNQTYHLFNPYFCDLYRTLKPHVKLLTIDAFFDLLETFLDHPTHQDIIEYFLLHQGWLEQDISYLQQNQLLQGRTNAILTQLGFTWPKITYEMLEGFINHIYLEGSRKFA